MKTAVNGPEWEYSVKGREFWMDCMWKLGQNPDSPFGRKETWEEHLQRTEAQGLEHRQKERKE